MTRVWVTRDEPEDGPLASALRRAGLVAVWEPVLETVIVGDAAAEVSALGADDWLVLTSPRAIRAVAIGPARVPRVAVVGEESARAALARGFRVELVSGTGGGGGIWQVLGERARGRRVCYPRSSLAEVPEVPGVEIIATVLYRTVARRFDVSVAARVQAAVFASPSAVRSVADRLGSLPLPAASIGPTTSRAVREAGGVLLVEAAERGFRSLAAAIAAMYPGR